MRYIKNKWSIITVLLAASAMTAFRFQTGKAPQYYSEKVERATFQTWYRPPGVSPQLLLSRSAPRFREEFRACMQTSTRT